MIAAISQNSFMKSMSVGLRIAIGVITLIMIVYGYFDLRKRIPRRRKEEQERELRRAKENLVTEGKRMSNDSSKDWQANLSLWLREIQNQFVFQLDKLAKEFSLQQQQKLNDEKQKLQRMNQGLDNNSKRINNAEKLMENTIKTFDDKVNDIEKYFRN
jgi:CHASE3 domain sensor protein